MESACDASCWLVNFYPFILFAWYVINETSWILRNKTESGFSLCFSSFFFFFLCVCSGKRTEWTKQHLFLHKDYIYIPEVNWINPVSILSLPTRPWNHECGSQIYGVLSVKIYFGRYIEHLNYENIFLDGLPWKGGKNDIFTMGLWKNCFSSALCSGEQCF